MENPMTRSGKARRKRQPAAPVAPQTPQDANAVNPALFESKEKEVAADDEASVQDPLQDWPESEPEDDRWLLERDDEGNEPPDR